MARQRRDGGIVKVRFDPRQSLSRLRRQLPLHKGASGCSRLLKCCSCGNNTSSAPCGAASPRGEALWHTFLQEHKGTVFVFMGQIIYIFLLSGSPGTSTPTNADHPTHKCGNGDSGQSSAKIQHNVCYHASAAGKILNKLIGNRRKQNAKNGQN